MSDTAAGRAQRDTALAASDDDVAETAARERQKHIHTSLPGIVQSFDPATQTAVVQPAIQRVWTEDGGVDIPAIMDVPVQFPGGGGFVFTFPVEKGDECELSFSERAIDFWFEHGGVQLPSEFRLHDYSDAFAHMGFRSKPNAIRGFFGGGAEIRSLDGQTVARVENNMVTLGNPALAAAAVRADIMSAILTAIKSHVHPVAGVTVGAAAVVSGPAPALAALPDPSAQNVKVS
jgi:hypothetical protein